MPITWSKPLELLLSTAKKNGSWNSPRSLVSKKALQPPWVSRPTVARGGAPDGAASGLGYGNAPATHSASLSAGRSCRLDPNCRAGTSEIIGGRFQVVGP